MQLGTCKPPQAVSKRFQTDWLSYQTQMAISLDTQHPCLIKKKLTGKLRLLIDIRKIHQLIMNDNDNNKFATQNRLAVDATCIVQKDTLARSKVK